MTEASARGPVLELGSGEGRFSRRLSEFGCRCIGLDPRYPPAPSQLIGVSADARRIPLRDASVGAVFAPNLLRQVDPSFHAEIASESFRVLAEGGVFVILEDHPDAREPAEENYRQTLELLCRAMPERGRPTLASDELELALEESLGRPYDRGVHENSELIERAEAPLDWLEAHRLGSLPELRSLRERVEQYGMSYGRYWSLAYVKQKESRG